MHAIPPIDYLAKDYQGFRRLMLQRMALLAPGWTERLPADVGVTVIEALAFAADAVSYRQDAVATEAYLETARSRVSVRRHARLVDYRMHDGCNAQAWVQLQAGSPVVHVPAGTLLLTAVPALDPVLAPGSPAAQAALAAGGQQFQTVADAVVHDDLNELRFWTWGEQGCCLPAGATEATLRGHHPFLRAGDVLVLAEIESPTIGRSTTQIVADRAASLWGESPDADPDQRFPVRLIEVRDDVDPSGTLFVGGVTEVTRIRWVDEDALPRPLCLSTVDGDREIAVAWGNIVLADHGATIGSESLGRVPAGRFRPSLARAPLTHSTATPPRTLLETDLTPAVSAELASGASGNELQAVFARAGLVLPDNSPVRGDSPLWSVSVPPGAAWQLREVTGRLELLEQAAPASGQGTGHPRGAIPAITLEGTLDSVPTPWWPRPDLLGSGPAATEFTVEIEHDLTASLRFGDGEHGLAPAADTAFTATYRVGNGSAGNVGQKALAHAITTVTGITAIGNPLPAMGGTEPESVEQVRRDAPSAFAVQERAVTEADWAEVTERNPRVQRAGATMRWTGSWHTAFVTADRFGADGATLPVDAEFEGELRDFLERFRMAGIDLEVDGPRYVAVHLALHVCVHPGQLRSPVARAVRAALAGFFDPDRLTFGQAVHLSSVLAAVHAVSGVQSVQVKRFERLREPASSGIDSGMLPMARLEIPRLDDDPSFPERGVLELSFGGGA